MSFIREENAEPIPGYRLIEPLGSGGFGEVWKCEGPGGILKAIKFVFGNLNSLDVEGARAEQEFKAINLVKEVRHPFVLSMDRIDKLDGELVIVMELADKSMHDMFQECQAAGLTGIPRDDLLRYLRDSAEALDHMMKKYSLSHLDIKPRNLFLISDRVKVADFGLVKSVERQSGGLSSVTPLYAPPETFSGKIHEHSDQYSLAIVYQEMLTGHRPFDGKNARQLMMQHTQQDPELRQLPEGDRPIIARALSKDPTKRYPNCMAFVKALYSAPRPELTGPASKVSTRTMSETMDDMLLEQVQDEGIDLGGPSSTITAEDGMEGSVSKLGLTMHQPDTGALRPTLIIGIGGFSRRALIELRCRLVDRFGELSKVPLIHFLYLDPDSEAVKQALRGSQEVACNADEVYSMHLQPIANYRRRMMEQLSEWLPQEKLFSLPRALHTQGVRALGRLSFVDHQQRLLGKVRRVIQQITHPDSLYQSVSSTGLALRDNKPRVFVLAAAGGGSSGMLVDLGYGVRRVLQQLRLPDADVTAVLLCGAPDDPATPKQEQANVYATLTELNHFAEPDVPFFAQYGADLPRLSDQGQPYQNIYLIKLNHRSPEALRDAVAHLGSYMFHELTTPLGIKLEANRKKRRGDGQVFRSFGTYAVWFPRGLLLRLAARKSCIDLLKEWQALGEPTALAEVEAACARTLADPELRFDALCGHIEASASTGFDGNLSAALTGLLSSLEEQSQQSIAQEDSGNWARQALGRIQDWVGGGKGSGSKHDSDLQKSKLSRALLAATQKIAEQWDQKLSDVAFGLMEHPGKRVAASEVALKRFVQFAHDTATAHFARLDQQRQKTQTAAVHLEKALESCISGGGFSFFGGRSRRVLRVYMDHLAAYSRQCMAESIVATGLHFFSSLRGKLEERIRELSFCRQRLRAMQENLENVTLSEDDVAPATRFETELTPIHTPLPSAESYWEAIRESETARLVLPDGGDDLEQASDKFLDTLTAEQWTQLDQALQDGVLSALGGLHKICVTNSDLARSLAAPVLAHLATTLGNLLPITDVAQVEFSAAKAGSVELASCIKLYYDSALPMLTTKKRTGQNAFLLVPASKAGNAFADEAKLVVAELELVKVPGQADLMFCREQGGLAAEDLKPMLRPCRQAYEELNVVPNTSPHARFDITDWVPVDP